MVAEIFDKEGNPIEEIFDSEGNPIDETLTPEEAEAKIQEAKEENQAELDKLQDEDYPQIVIIIRKLDEILDNRAGNAPNKSINLFNHYKYFQDKPCYLPCEQLIIRSDGKVSLCPNDAYGEVTLGDTNKSSLLEIWYGKLFKKIRKILLIYGRKEIQLCNICDN